MVLLVRDTKKDILLMEIFESIGVKEMLRWMFCFDCQGIVNYGFIPEGKTVNKYTNIIRPLRDTVRRKRLE